MSKPFVNLIGVAIVVLTAFVAGRWTAAPVIEQSNSSGSDLGMNEHLKDADLVLSGSQQNTALTNPANTNSKPVLKVPNHSYASDYQQMQMLIALAATNPQLAMERAQEFKGAIKAKAEAAILDIWAGNDPNGAWAWVQSFQPGNNEQFISLLESIGRSEPRTAVSFAEKFADTHREMRKDIYLSAVTGITQAGAYGVATEFIEHLDIEAAIKAELINFVAGAWAAYEPQAAMQWIMKQPEDIRASAASRMGESWADSDPQGATDFAASQQGSERDPILQQSFSKWLVADSTAATAWLAAEPNQKNLDPLLSEVATQPDLANGQVKTALSWAGRVSDPELRLNTLTSILSAFKQRDPKAAAAYLQEITYLTDSERSRLIEGLAFEN